MRYFTALCQSGICIQLTPINIQNTLYDALIVQIRTSTGSHHDIIDLHQTLNPIRQLSRPSPNRPKKKPATSSANIRIVSRCPEQDQESFLRLPGVFLAHSLVLTGPLFLTTRHAVCHLTSPLRSSIPYGFDSLLNNKQEPRPLPRSWKKEPLRLPLSRLRSPTRCATGRSLLLFSGLFSWLIRWASRWPSTGRFGTPRIFRTMWVC